MTAAEVLIESVYGARLFGHHQDLLARSAIDAEVARERGYVSVDTKAELKRRGWADWQPSVPGLLIPIHSTAGELALHEYRPDHPRLRDGRPVKYERPAGSPVVIDCHPRVQPHLLDGTVSLIITEGVRKADAAISAGYPSIALLGVWNWLRGGAALPDWRDIALKNRTLRLIFDSDSATNPKVAQALTELAGWLEHRGANVEVFTLPADGAGKTGLDDYLAGGGNVNDLHGAAPAPKTSNDPDGTSWTPRPLDTVVAGILEGSIQRPQPTVGYRTDGQAIFYRAAVNGLAGTSGSGKSMIVQFVAGQELIDGNHVFWIDFEGTEQDSVGRLLAFGVEPEIILNQFHYLRPDEPYGLQARRDLEDLVANVQPTLVAIDSTGEAMSIDNLDPDKDKDTAPWMRKLPRALADLGPAVVLVDHTTNADADGKELRPSGSQRKRAAITGAQYMVATIREFAAGRQGSAKIVCAKDRHGNYLRGSKVAEFTVTPEAGHIIAALDPPAASVDFRPTTLMEKVSRYIELHPDATKRAIRKDVKGASQYKDTALGLLIAEGWVTCEAPDRNGDASKHRSAKPYRHAEAGDDNHD